MKFNFYIKRLSFTGSLFFIISIATGCVSSNLFVKDFTHNNKDYIIAAEKKSKNIILKYKDNQIVEVEKSLLERFTKIGLIKTIYHKENAFLIITKENGIYILPDNSTELIHLTVEKEKLASKKIRNIYYYKYKKIRKLYVTYNSRAGSGYTECILDKNWNIKKYINYRKKTSDIKSDYINQINSDLKGNLWFKYSPAVEEGISRLTVKGEWHHFTKFNSELGGNSVYIFRIEKKKKGFKGDNIWFVTDSGLSRLQYDGKSEKWKLYGEKQTVVNTIIGALGIRDWFTDAIINIKDIIILDDAILIADKYAVYHFKKNSINRFLPETTGGLTELTVRSIYYRNGKIIAEIIKFIGKNLTTIESVMIFDIKNRTWKKLDYWHILKGYPESIYFIPYSEKYELLILNSSFKKSAFALYNYETNELKKLDYKITEK